ncbi:MAG: cytidine deaminase [Clostridia bacterium]|nr:cytidine deaminase [Clostridia bacterium]
MDHDKLIALAEQARSNSYAVYSDFTVGAALLCSDGSIYMGCNIENASFTPTCCAERVAIFSAIADGKREFCAIAVAGGKKGSSSLNKCYPCGVCRQVLSEFCDERLEVIFSDGTKTSLSELLPFSFGLNNMQK